MSTIINATTTNGVVIEPDNSGSLVLQTNSGTTALTIDTSQNATFAGTLTATGKLASSSMPTGSVLQVVSTDYTGTASSTSATPADVSGFAATITPSSASNKILVFVSVAFGFANDAYPYVLLKRNGTSISVGATASGSQINVFLSGTGTADAGSTVYRFHQASKSYLDSPSSTSALTYQIQLASPYISSTGYINRVSASDNAAYIQFPTSSITVMEIKG
jgi:hypothetical protein